jgi:hypothetical protein
VKLVRSLGFRWKKFCNISFSLSRALMMWNVRSCSSLHQQSAARQLLCWCDHRPPSTLARRSMRRLRRYPELEPEESGESEVQ